MVRGKIKELNWDGWLKSPNGPFECRPRVDVSINAFLCTARRFRAQRDIRGCRELLTARIRNLATVPACAANGCAAGRARPKPSPKAREGPPEFAPERGAGSEPKRWLHRAAPAPSRGKLRNAPSGADAGNGSGSAPFFRERPNSPRQGKMKPSANPGRKELPKLRSKITLRWGGSLPRNRATTTRPPALLTEPAPAMTRRADSDRGVSFAQKKQSGSSG